MGFHSCGKTHKVFSGYDGWRSSTLGIVVGMVPKDSYIGDYAQSKRGTADGGARQQKLGSLTVTAFVEWLLSQIFRSGVGGGYGRITSTSCSASKGVLPNPE